MPRPADLTLCRECLRAWRASVQTQQAPSSSRSSRGVPLRDGSRRARRPVEVQSSDDDQEEAGKVSDKDASRVVDGVELLISLSPSINPTKDEPKPFAAGGKLPVQSRGQQAAPTGQSTSAASAWLSSSSPLQQVLPSPSYSNELPRRLLSNIFYAD